MHISLLNVPVDGEGGTSVFFFFPFSVNQKTQEHSLGFFFLNMAKSMMWELLWLHKAHAFNKHSTLPPVGE